MTYIWAAIVIFSVTYGFAEGTISQVGNAAMEGAKAAVDLCIGISAVTCLWTALSEVMRNAGIMQALSRIMFPVLKLIYPKASKKPEAIKNISANVSANFLGLGNAATPLGIKAAKLMTYGRDSASDELCLLIVINTASIQLLPTTIAAVRSASGCASPFDILPAVWMTSLSSVLAGIAACFIFRKIWR